jgi:hypothetical protein
MTRVTVRIDVNVAAILTRLALIAMIILNVHS